MITEFAPATTLVPQKISWFSKVKTYLRNKILKSGTTLTFDGDLTIHATGNIRLVSDQHVIVLSGHGFEPNRPGYNYGVWLNPMVDGDGNPLQEVMITDGSILKRWEPQYYSSGELALPEGWYVA